MKKSADKLRESIIDKIMTAFSSGQKIRPGIRRMIDKDPELNKKFKVLHKNNRKLGENYQKLYDGESRKYIADICKWEIEKFSYKFEEKA